MVLVNLVLSVLENTDNVPDLRIEIQVEDILEI